MLKYHTLFDVKNLYHAIPIDLLNSMHKLAKLTLQLSQKTSQILLQLLCCASCVSTASLLPSSFVVRYAISNFILGVCFVYDQSVTMLL